MQVQRSLRRVGSRRAPRKFGLGVMHDVNITLAHEYRVVGADQHRTERVVAVRDRVAGDGIGRAEVGDHLVAFHIAQPKAREASWEGGHEPEPPRGGFSLPFFFATRLKVLASGSDRNVIAVQPVGGRCRRR